MRKGVFPEREKHAARKNVPPQTHEWVITADNCDTYIYIINMH